MRTHWVPRATPVAAGAGCLLMLAACASQAPRTASSVAPVTVTSPASTIRAVPATPSSPSPSAPQQTRAQACTDKQITISLRYTGAVMGQEGGYLAFTNRSSAVCELTGWPTVDAVTRVGTTAPMMRAKATMLGAWQAASSVPIVTVAPGHSAYAVVAGEDNPPGNATSCPAPYTRLEVTIPGGTSPTTVSAWLPNDLTYLPACASINGGSGGEVSYIVPLSSLPH